MKPRTRPRIQAHQHRSRINLALSQNDHVNPMLLGQIRDDASQRLAINIPEQEFSARQRAS